MLAYCFPCGFTSLQKHLLHLHTLTYILYPHPIACTYKNRNAHTCMYIVSTCTPTYKHIRPIMATHMFTTSTYTQSTPYPHPPTWQPLHYTPHTHIHIHVPHIEYSPTGPHTCLHIYFHTPPHHANTCLMTTPLFKCKWCSRMGSKGDSYQELCVIFEPI